MTVATPNRPARAKKQDSNSPYCAFKSDKHRLWALISRDVRLVVCACVLLVAGAPFAPRLVQLIAKLGG